MKTYKQFTTEKYTTFDNETKEVVKFPAVVLKKVKELTNINDHNEARLLVAKELTKAGNRGGSGLVKRYETYKKLQKKDGYMKHQFVKSRFADDKYMRTELEKTFSNWKEIWNSM